MNDLPRFEPSPFARAPYVTPPIPNPNEVATLVVGGRKWDDWTSVKIEHRFAEAYPLFTFSNVERPAAIQFRPGDECWIYLAGLIAITGVITVRQVSYDPNNHAVQLMGKGVTFFAARSSIINETGNFDGQTFEQIAKAVIAPTGVGVRIIGQLNNTPIDPCQVQHGEKIWDTLERLARPLGIVLGSDEYGNFLLIGEHPAPASDSLVEGVNILSCKCIFSREGVYSEYLVDSQRPATDGTAGADANQQRAGVPGTAPRYSPLLTPSEQPGADPLERARNEAVWHEGTFLTAFITVQGWKKPSGGLWESGGNAKVVSPMAMLDQVMSFQSVTFSQDPGGTTTTLECVPQFKLRGRSSDLVGAPDLNVPQDPSTYEKTAIPAPPATTVPEPPPDTLPE
jgi:prophage tail gpP-like protein